jgi:NAD(P)H-hydrate epimerase
MRATENAAFKRGITAEALMDQAGAGIAGAVSQFFPTPGQCLVFAGKGNNAGDALVAAEHLARAGWQIETRLSFAEKDCGELMRKKLRSLQKESRPRAKERASNIIILDGLLGLGATPPLREPLRAACREMNRLRRDLHPFVFAIDIPTGLESDSGKADRDCVFADFTITIGFAKQGLIADSAANFVGRIEVIPLAELLPPQKAAADLLASAAALRPLLPRRSYDAYKNQFGRIGVVAGSKGFTGAAIMCSLGALRGGAGLVEVFVSENIYEVVAAAAPAEAMVKPVRSYRELPNESIDVWAVGPGLGREHADEIVALVQSARQPMVVDADALNVLSGKAAALKRCKGPRLLTPHPGEIKRIFSAKKATRAQIAKGFCAKYPVTLLFKGSRTIVAERHHPLSYNTTGNPGMATGGMGDVLTGVCAALIAQKLSCYDAARLGAWLCGRAAEISIFNGKASEQSLLPTDVLHHLGAAFNELRREIT